MQRVEELLKQRDRVHTSEQNKKTQRGNREDRRLRAVTAKRTKRTESVEAFGRRSQLPRAGVLSVVHRDTYTRLATTLTFPRVVNFPFNQARVARVKPLVGLSRLRFRYASIPGTSDTHAPTRYPR